jgi:hypothetical protein
MSEYNPTFQGGPFDGGRVALAYWVLDTIEVPYEYFDTNVVYVVYDIDDKTKDYIYKGQRVIPKGRPNERESASDQE